MTLNNYKCLKNTELFILVWNVLIADLIFISIDCKTFWLKYFVWCFFIRNLQLNMFDQK